MGTLRVAFLSGSVLELAATLGVALVAVTVGVRLVGGGLGLEAGLTVLVLAPEVYLPLRRLGAEYHASADGLAVAERMLALLDAPGRRPRAATRRAAEPRRGAGPARAASRSPTRRARARARRVDLDARAGRDAWRSWARAARARARSPRCCLGFAGPDRGPRDRRRRRPRGAATRLRGARQLAWVPQRPAPRCAARVADNIRLGDPPRRPTRSCAGPRRSPAPTASSARSPAATTRVVGDGGRAAVARRAPADRRSRARSCATRRSSSSTSRPPTSTRRASRSSREAVGRLCAGRTVLLIAHRPELVAHADRVVRLAAGRPRRRAGASRRHDAGRCAGCSRSARGAAARAGASPARSRSAR